jgi:tetratricopeptide (TPR) repeat protein
MVEMDPYSDEGHAVLGGIFQVQGEVESAGAHFARALALNPFFALPYLKLLDLVRVTGQKEAVELAEQGVRYCPNHVHVLRAALKIWEDLNNTEKVQEITARLAVLENHQSHTPPSVRPFNPGEFA